MEGKHERELAQAVNFARGVINIYAQQGYKPPNDVKVRFHNSDTDGTIIRVDYCLYGQKGLPSHILLRVNQRIRTHAALIFGSGILRAKHLTHGHKYWKNGTPIVCIRHSDDFLSAYHFGEEFADG